MPKFEFVREEPKPVTPLLKAVVVTFTPDEFAALKQFLGSVGGDGDKYSFYYTPSGDNTIRGDMAKRFVAVRDQLYYAK